MKFNSKPDLKNIIKTVGSVPYNPFGIPLETFRNKITEEEGSITFRIKSMGNLFDKNLKKVTVFDLPLSNSHMILERDELFHLNLIHISETFGLRVASLDGADYANASGLFLANVWSPKELRLHVGDSEKKIGLRFANGKSMPQKVIKASDGSFVLVGDEGVDVRMLTVKKGSTSIVEPSAKEIFDFRILRTQTLIDNCKKGDFLLETTLVQLGISMLVSSMEVYLQKRFIELEKEGWSSNFDALCERMFSAKYTASRKQAIEDLASEAKMSKLEAAFQAARAEMSFQEMRKVRRAYKSCYGIDVDSSVDPKVVSEISEFVHYRHRIIHAAKDLSILNEDKVPPEKPVFASKETLERAAKAFSSFVEAFHKGTLKST